MTEQQKLDSEILEWFETLTADKPVSPREFLKQSADLKQRAVASVRGGALRSQKSGMFFDAQLAAAEEAVETQSEELRKKLWELAYRGEVSSEVLAEETAALAPQLLPQNLQAGTCQSCLICLGCIGCVTCVGCVVCIFTGFEATMTAVFTASAVTTASIAAAS